MEGLLSDCEPPGCWKGHILGARPRAPRAWWRCGLRTAGEGGRASPPCLPHALRARTHARRGTKLAVAAAAAAAARAPGERFSRGGAQAVCCHLVALCSQLCFISSCSCATVAQVANLDTTTMCAWVSQVTWADPGCGCQAAELDRWAARTAQWRQCVEHQRQVRPPAGPPARASSAAAAVPKLAGNRGAGGHSSSEEGHAAVYRKCSTGAGHARGSFSKMTDLSLVGSAPR